MVIWVFPLYGLCGGSNRPSEACRLHSCFPRGTVCAEAASKQLLPVQRRKPNCTMTNLNLVAARKPKVSIMITGRETCTMTQAHKTRITPRTWFHAHSMHEASKPALKDSQTEGFFDEINLYFGKLSNKEEKALLVPVCWWNLVSDSLMLFPLWSRTRIRWFSLAYCE